MAQREKLLILTKTYPSPSQKYRETTCVAAVNEEGILRRIYPVPFRLLTGDQQFKKWEWIDATLIKSKSDPRPESHKVDYDHIQCSGNIISTNDYWKMRMKWILPHVFPNIDALEAKRLEINQTFGFLHVSKLKRLIIKKETNTSWTKIEEDKLKQELLFDSNQTKNRRMLQKMPHRFWYEFECESSNDQESHLHKHMIIDWEAGALYWNCVANYGDQWEDKFRQKLELEFAGKDLYLLMGNMQSRPWIWLIIGLYYPPKPNAKRLMQEQQQNLF